MAGRKTNSSSSGLYTLPGTVAGGCTSGSGAAITTSFPFQLCWFREGWGEQRETRLAGFLPRGSKLELNLRALFIFVCSFVFLTNTIQPLISTESLVESGGHRELNPSARHFLNAF